MRTVFNRELESIHQNIRLLGVQANQAISSAVHALVNRDAQAAREVKRRDLSSDQLRYEVEQACVNVIATQQPVARDLRRLLAATLVAVELERCGDYAKGVAKATRRIERAHVMAAPYNIVEIEFYARGMLERAVEAFLSTNVEGAWEVIEDDAHVDHLYKDLRLHVTTNMMSNAIYIEGGLWILHAGHCLERFADRATNIAGRVLFVDNGDFRGELERHSAFRANRN
jgi:phosphate transport system protein